MKKNTSKKPWGNIVLTPNRLEPPSCPIFRFRNWPIPKPGSFWGLHLAVLTSKSVTYVKDIGDRTSRSTISSLQQGPEAWSVVNQFAKTSPKHWQEMCVIL